MHRILEEADLDVVGRVVQMLKSVCEEDVEVDVARDGENPYFAGLLRAINKSALLHADYAPYVSKHSFAPTLP